MYWIVREQNALRARKSTLDKVKAGKRNGSVAEAAEAIDEDA
jgi:hypothetical protein